MRHLGNIDNAKDARSLVAFLLVQGIECHLSQDDHQFEVWVKDEDRLSEASEMLAAFRQNPQDAKYSQAVPAATKIVKQQHQQRKAVRRRIVHVGSRNLQRPPRFTLILIGICVLVGFLTRFGIMPPDDTPRQEKIIAHVTNPVYRLLQFTCVGEPRSLELVKKHALNQKRSDAIEVRTVSLMRGELWRLITPIFIHYGPMHIAFNMYMLFQFGSLIERRYSSLRLVILVLLTAAISNFVQCTVPEAIGGSSPVAIGGPVYIITQLGGMSGVVYGLFGYVWIKSIYDREFGFRIPDSSIFIMIAWLFGCMFSQTLAQAGIGIFPANVANWAHGVGLVVGMAIGYLHSPETKR